MTECLKYLLCLFLLLVTSNWSIPESIVLFRDEVIFRPKESFLLAIPAFLYTIQNNLFIYALSKLDAATYQITYQLKILTTAGFSILLLNKKLLIRQWISLTLLVIGVAMIQNKTEKVLLIKTSDNTRGIVAVLMACLCSGVTAWSCAVNSNVLSLYSGPSVQWLLLSAVAPLQLV